MHECIYTCSEDRYLDVLSYSKPAVLSLGDDYVQLAPVLLPGILQGLTDRSASTSLSSDTVFWWTFTWCPQEPFLLDSLRSPRGGNDLFGSSENNKIDEMWSLGYLCKTRQPVQGEVLTAVNIYTIFIIMITSLEFPWAPFPSLSPQPQPAAKGKGAWKSAIAKSPSL